MPCRRNVGSGSLTTGYSAESTSLLGKPNALRKFLMLLVSKYWLKSKLGYTAIVEERSRQGEVGLASLDLHVGKLIICQFSDSQNYTRVISKLNIFHPAEVSVLIMTSIQSVSN